MGLIFQMRYYFYVQNQQCYWKGIVDVYILLAIIQLLKYDVVVYIKNIFRIWYLTCTRVNLLQFKLQL